MTFGQGRANFLVNSPAAVAQRVKTRLNLWQGEWFLDQLAGTPWIQKVVGTRGVDLYDQAIIQVILQTPGVISLASYNSSLDSRSRVLTISGSIDTQYGVAELSAPITLSS